MKKIKSSLLFFLLCTATAVTAGNNTPVTIVEDSSSYTLANGIVKTIISKKSGSIISIIYHGKEVLAGRGGRATALWSHDASAAVMIRKITIDPAANNGARGEVSIKGISGGLPMGNGPGGSFIADIEIRYALERGASGIYTYCIFDHLPAYPASSMGEARFVAFLEKGFDWICVDDKRTKYYPLQPGGLDLSKYTLTANQRDNPAFGWVNAKDKTGFWFINPSMEYMSGGPTKVDFLCHRDTKINGAPCVLNYWRSSHYGGSTVEVAAGEKWSKIIGPFMIYLNNGTEPATVKKDAQQKAITEREQWPYQWVNVAEYPLKKQRATIRGSIVLKDPPTAKNFTKLLVGVSAPDYAIGKEGTATYRMVDWQFDTKFYQFWTNGNTKGEFVINHIRPGKYTLHAIADGVLGEYFKTGIEVKAGEKIDLGNLEWTPVRYGKQLWDIGVANRNSMEFLGGDRFFENDIVKQYPKYFPNDVNYVIGKSDFTKDWFFEQLPHVENPDSPEANTMPEQSQQALIKSLGIEALPETEKNTALKVISDLGLSGKYAKGKSTSWKINFPVTDSLSGTMTLRLAISGTGTQKIIVTVNGQPAGNVTNLRIDGTPNRSGSSGMWWERNVSFDAALLKKGDNVIALTIAEGQVVNGIMYDYVRLEYAAVK